MINLRQAVRSSERAVVADRDLEHVTCGDESRDALGRIRLPLVRQTAPQRSTACSTGSRRPCRATLGTIPFRHRLAVADPEPRRRRRRTGTSFRTAPVDPETGPMRMAMVHTGAHDLDRLIIIRHGSPVLRTKVPSGMTPARG